MRSPPDGQGAASHGPRPDHLPIASPTSLAKHRDGRPVEGRCRECGLPIRWARTAARNKAIPLDIEPSLDTCCGNFLLSQSNVATYVPDMERVRLVRRGVPVFVAHFATCSKRRAR
jgi:hypothetical protein